LELNSKLEIRPSAIEGQGIFALQGFDEGDRFQVVIGEQPTVIMSDAEFREYLETVDSWDAVYLGNGLHRVSMVKREDNASNSGNHSCDPNTILVGDERLALRRIEAGEEITVDYALHSPTSWTMECNCGVANCVGVVRGVVEDTA
jgi:hypothetical protein